MRLGISPVVIFTHPVAQDFVFGPNVPMINENALSNLMVDIDFLDSEFKRLGKSFTSFQELHLVRSIIESLFGCSLYQSLLSGLYRCHKEPSILIFTTNDPKITVLCHQSQELAKSAR